MRNRILNCCTWPYSLAGQPLHKREEEGSGVMSIHELFQRLAVTRCVQNRTCEDIAPGWSERMVGTVPTYYWTRRSGTWLVSSYVCWWRGAIWLGCTPGCSRYNSRTGMAPDLSSSLLWRGWPARLVQHIHIDLLLQECITLLIIITCIIGIWWVYEAVHRLPSQTRASASWGAICSLTQSWGSTWGSQLEWEGLANSNQEPSEFNLVWPDSTPAFHSIHRSCKLLVITIPDVTFE